MLGPLLKLLPFSSSRYQLAVLAAAFGLALLAAPKFVDSAHAFTMEGQSNTNADGSTKFGDPDDRVTRFGSGGNGSGTTLRQGNTTFQFGPVQQDSGDARFKSDADRMFNPLGRPGDAR
jgi:hypothetical protein